jgi:uncharacterized membrane protein HdeD (DUF308 family)
MATIATDAMSTLEQIHSINMRAVFGGTLLILCCLVAAGLFKNKPHNASYIFVVLVGIIAIVSGVLLASALYVIQNPDITAFWSVST